MIRPAGMVHPRLLSLAFAALALGGCDLLRDSPGDPSADASPGKDAAVDAATGCPAGPPVETGYPPPRSDLVKRIGGPDTLDIVAWNVRNLGAENKQIAAPLADVITSLDLDLIAIEEVASIDAWNELVARLPEHEGVLSSHVYSPTNYQKVGVLYRKSTLEVVDVDLLRDRSYESPRPPLVVSFRYQDCAHAAMTFDVIGLHLKALDEGIERRRTAISDLDKHVRAQIDGGGEDEIILLGDFNQEIVSEVGKGVMAPMLADADGMYDVRTLAASTSTPPSYIGRETIDHLVTTRGLAAEAGAASASILGLDSQIAGYRTSISDHRPVFFAIPLAPR